MTQAYIQSATDLNRDFYIRPPIELGNKETILKVVKPLYGVPEAGNHWLYTYHRHHTQNLALKQSTFDPCLLYSTNETVKGYGILGLQTDDTLILADDDFAAEEEIQLEKAKFIAKKRKLLTETEPLNFSGGDIKKEKDSHSICLTQEMHCRNLRLVKSEPTDIVGTQSKTRKAVSQLDQFVSYRARGAYIASVCQPEASFDVSSAAQTTNPDENNIKLLNKRHQWQINNSSRGLKFVQLDKTSLDLFIFTDSSFANNSDHSSQIGFVIVLADCNKRANILH